MYYYNVSGHLCAALTPLDLPVANPPEANQTCTVLVQRPPETSRVRYAVTHGATLLAPEESIAFLDPARLPSPVLDAAIQGRIDQGTLSAVNVNHPRWQSQLSPEVQKTTGFRVHLVAVGDVGSTFVTALKLLGGDCIATIGLFDLNQAVVQRWVTELGQVHCDGVAMPEVVAVNADELFDCDVLVFAATRAIPAVGSGVSDVRMAQLEANRPLVSHYGKLARQADFQGLFMVLSDPVDPLCQAAYQASNQDETGRWDGMGLLPEQIQGFGLGVMQGRSVACAKEWGLNPDAVRCFGPHGQGLVVVNDLADYDHELSLQMTDWVTTANLRVRDLGFKPYVAPALSSGAFQLLATLRGQDHESSQCLGGIWFGARNRFTRQGVGMATQTLPDGVYARLAETADLLHSMG